MFDFIAIDFETATENLNSACSIGVVAVKNLEIVDYFESYIQPPYNRFADNNISVHGITPDITERAPTLDELWFELSQYFSEHIPVLAHNAHFDMSVLRLSTKADIPDFPYIDSISIVSPYVEGSRSLEHCVEVLGISMDQHHNALSDATAVAEIAICVLRNCGCLSMWEFLCKSYTSFNQFSELNPQEKFFSRKKAKFQKHMKPSDIAPTIEVKTTNPLYGKTIVFTGDLSISRDDAFQIAVNCGAIVKTSISRKVDYLVVGTQDVSLVGEDGLSSKQEKALDMNATGKAHIEFINEQQFFSLSKEEI